jgi:pimeloyl-ACP methyl ester carboxylesterase
MWPAGSLSDSIPRPWNQVSQAARTNRNGKGPSMTAERNNTPGTAGTAHRLQAAPYTSRHVDVAGLRLHYLDYGTAGRPTILCVHGGAAHSHWFDFVAGGLTDRFRVLSLDQRGHGESAWADPPEYSYDRYAADIDAFVHALDLRNFVLIGHSMGGTVSLLYASRHPGRMSKLVVVDSTLQMTEERVANLRTVGTRSGSSYATREEFLARYRLRPAETPAAPEVIHHLAQRSGRQSEDGTWRHKFDRAVYARRESIDGGPLWRHIKVPAMLVKGGISDRITPQVLATIRTACPHVAFAEVPGASHHVTLDNPDGFVEAVRPFLTSTF